MSAAPKLLARILVLALALSGLEATYARDSTVTFDLGAGPGGVSMSISGRESPEATVKALRGYREAAVVDRVRLLATLGDIKEELARLQGVVGSSDAWACRRSAKDLKALRKAVRQLQDDLRLAPILEVGPAHRDIEVSAPQPQPLPPPQPAGPVALNEAQFSEILDAVQAESFEDGKLGVLRDATDYAWYTVAQVVRVLGAFSFGSGKLKALEIMAPQIVDPEHAFKIYGAFTFDGDKKKARKILRRARR